MRTYFATENGRPVQCVENAVAIGLEVADRRSVVRSERMSVVMAEMQAAARIPFRLEELPLVRFVLYAVDDGDHVLFINMHHIIGDQWSLGVLARDLSSCYAARCAGHEPDLRPLRVHFADYVQWHRAWVDSGAVDAQLDYWRQQLAGSSSTDLPSDRARPPVQSGDGAVMIEAIPLPIASGINELCSRSRVSPFMVILAALDVVLTRYTGSDDLAIGTVIANRNVLESEELIGTFVNTLVVRVDLSGDPSFDELLQRVQDVALDAYANQDIPFSTLVNELAPARDPVDHPSSRSS